METIEFILISPFSYSSFCCWGCCCFFKLYYESVTKINIHTFAIAKIQQELQQEEQQPDSLPVCMAMLDLPLQQQKSNCCGT